VNINDKLSKLEDVYSFDNEISGSFVYDGKLLENMTDQTFAKRFVLDGAQFGIMCGEEGGGNELKWFRFPRFYLNDYFYLDTNCWDAVTFVPIRNIKFFGFGLMGNYHSYDTTYKVKWIIDEVESEEYIKETKWTEDVDPEKKWLSIRLSDFDIKPIKVPKDGKIDVLVKVVCDEYAYDKRRTTYGHEGYQDRYSTLDG